MVLRATPGAPLGQFWLWNNTSGILFVDISLLTSREARELGIMPSARLHHTYITPRPIVERGGHNGRRRHALGVGRKGCLLDVVQRRHGDNLPERSCPAGAGLRAAAHRKGASRTLL